jgi:hypothetical protein
VVSQPAAADAAAERRAANVRERDKKAKAGTGFVKKAVVAPVVPAKPTPPEVPAAAADTAKPVVPAPPVVAAKPSAADTAAKRRAANVRERDKKAKAGSGFVKKAVTVPPAAPVTGSDTSKKAEKLNDRNTKARENTKTLNSNLPKTADPVAPPAVK